MICKCCQQWRKLIRDSQSLANLNNSEQHLMLRHLLWVPACMDRPLWIGATESKTSSTKSILNTHTISCRFKVILRTLGHTTHKSHKIWRVLMKSYRARCQTFRLLPMQPQYLISKPQTRGSTNHIIWASDRKLVNQMWRLSWLALELKFISIPATNANTNPSLSESWKLIWFPILDY